MKRKILSLFLALSMALACTVFAVPVSAAGEATAVEFSDNFENETDTTPDNWVLRDSNNSTITIVTENGNKFLRFATGGNTNVVTTKQDLVKIPFSGTEKVIFTFRMRTTNILKRSTALLANDADLIQSDATDAIYCGDASNNSYAIVHMRNNQIRYADGEYSNGHQVFGNIKNAEGTADLSSEKDKWYSFTVNIIPSTRMATFEIVDEAGNTYTASGKLASATFGANTFEAIERICFDTRDTETAHLIDIDDVSIGYYHAPVVTSFSDDFNSETDTTPDNWEIVEAENGTTLSIVKEGNESFLRLNITRNTKNPIVATKAGVINTPFEGNQKHLLKMRIRSSNVAKRSTVRLGGSLTDWQDASTNKHCVFSVRNSVIKYTSGNDSNGNQAYSDVSGLTTVNDTWYDVTAVIVPATRSINYTIVDETTGRTYTATGALATNSFGAIDMIENLVIESRDTETGHTIDIDDVYYGYYVIPEIRSFANDFEGETKNAAPSDWEDRNGVSTLTVMEDTDGNQFVRVTKAAGNAKPPMVAMKEGNINLPLKEGNNKAVVIEAKVRKNDFSDGYRSLFMINPPADITSVDYGQSRYSMFYIHGNKSIYVLHKDNGDNTIAYQDIGTATENEWVSYKAIYIPDQGKILHYVGDRHVGTVTNLPAEISSMTDLTHIAFSWREYSSTGAGTMDFDDIKIYEMSAIPEVTVTYDKEALEAGKVVATVTIQNKAPKKTSTTDFIAITALYTKDANGNWYIDSGDLVTAKMEVTQWRSMQQNLSVTVDDPSNQMIKTFVWYGDTLVPLCTPTELE